MSRTSRKELPLKVVRMSTAMTIDNAVDLRAKLTTLLTRPDMPDVVFDLSDVEQVDAAGIGALAAAYSVGITFGHDMFIYNPPEPMRNLLKSLDLVGFFPTIKYESELLSRVRDTHRIPD